jgi:CPA2 family monovalent cation:H+ antiporter-2
LQEGRRQSAAARLVRNLFWQLVLNVALIAAVFISAAVLSRWLQPSLAWLPEWTGGARTIGWLGAALITLPVYVATVRKMQAMGMMLSEIATSGAAAGSRNPTLRSFLAHTLLVVQALGLALLTVLLSLALLPPMYVSLFLSAAILLLAVWRGPALNRWYSRAKFALLETWSQPPHEPVDEHPMPALLREARMESFALAPGAAAVGTLIRELQLRSETGASIVAIERDGKTTVNPDADFELQAGDTLLLLGSPDQLLRARAHLARRPVAE